MQRRQQLAGQKKAKAYNPNRKPSGGAIRKELIRMMEPKMIQTSLDTGTISTTGTLQLLTTIPQGSAQSQRIGDQIKYKSLTARLRIQAVSSGGGSVGRFMLILWKENSTPTTSQILQSVGSDDVVISPKDWDNRKKFNVLFDSGPVFVQMADDASGAGTEWTNNSIVYHSPLIVIPLTNVPQVVYDAASSTNSNNRLYFMYATANSNDISTKAWFRVTYYDA